MTAKTACAKKLFKKNIGQLFFDESLAKHSTWKIGGPADIFIIPSSRQGLQDTIQFANDHSLPIVIIGGASNLLFDDAGVRGIVIKIDAAFAHIEIEANRIVAGAGTWVPCLARAVGKAGLTGLEHIIGIPGTFGGLIFMNGGSQRKNIGGCVREVLAIDRKGELRKFSHQECQFAYRNSVFQEMDLIILEAELECPSGEPVSIRREMISILESRRNKFPRKLPNCGSVFASNPAMHQSFGPPGKIIEDCQLKGTSIGDAQVSRQHANFIINIGRATSSQVLRLVEVVRQQVHERTNFWLGTEVRYVSHTGEIKPLHQFL